MANAYALMENPVVVKIRPQGLKRISVSTWHKNIKRVVIEVTWKSVTASNKYHKNWQKNLHFHFFGFFFLVFKFYSSMHKTSLRTENFHDKSFYLYLNTTLTDKITDASWRYLVATIIIDHD